MAWEQDVGPGWRSIVMPLIKRAEREGVSIHQVKEKFGGLRFYTGPASEDFYREVDEAERKSVTLCEECGEPGKRVTLRGWIKTRCPAHDSI